MSTPIRQPLRSRPAELKPRAFERYLPGPRSGFALHILVCDAICVLFSCVAVFYVRYFPQTWETANRQPVKENLGILLLYLGLVIVCLDGQNLYRINSIYQLSSEVIGVFKAVLTSTVLLSCFMYLSGKKNTSRIALGFTAILTVLTLSGWRWLNRELAARRAAHGRGTRNVVIVGAGRVGHKLAKYLEDNRHLGYSVRGFLDDNPPADATTLGGVAELPRIARSEFIDEVFITPPSDRELVQKLALDARTYRFSVKLVPELYEGLAWHAPIEYAGELPIVALHHTPMSAPQILLKRAIDVTVAGISLLLLLPVLSLIALIVRMDSPGAIFYSSLRVGRKGGHFPCYKFRTMVRDADAQKRMLEQLNERRNIIFKIANDPRITRSGRLLRKYSLDELPQLWNVLKGDMSLVGPRPPVVGEYRCYGLDHLRRLDVVPGITGLWQVRARRDPSFDEYVRLDLEYIENWSIWLDLKILLETIPVVVRGTGQ